MLCAPLSTLLVLIETPRAFSRCRDCTAFSPLRKAMDHLNDLAFSDWLGGGRASLLSFLCREGLPMFWWSCHMTPTQPSSHLEKTTHCSHLKNAPAMSQPTPGAIFQSFLNSFPSFLKSKRLSSPSPVSFSSLAQTKQTNTILSSLKSSWKQAHDGRSFAVLENQKRKYKPNRRYDILILYHKYHT